MFCCGQQTGYYVVESIFSCAIRTSIRGQLETFYLSKKKQYKAFSSRSPLRVKTALLETFLLPKKNSTWSVFLLSKADKCFATLLEREKTCRIHI